MTAELCRYLKWDSDFFGSRIARVIGSQLTTDNLDPILSWCIEQEIDCLYFLGDIEDANTIKLAEDNNFRFMDIRVILEKRILAKPVLLEEYPGILIRQFKEIDIPILKLIAKSIYCDTRFYYDSNFPVSLVNQMYEIWIEKSCNGYADTVFVAEIDEKPVGYVTCHLQEGMTGQIGLIGVSSQYQKRRVGQNLLIESFRWFADMGREHITIATQGRNFSGQRLFQRCGFVTQLAQIWYHKWFPK
jgi:dTDP-4-amino-4,6-dideoxy-D-galactose acyltransferase